MAETFTVEILEREWEITIQNETPSNVEVLIGDEDLPQVTFEDPVVSVFTEPAEVIVVSVAEQGLPGFIGEDGASAYDVALENGFVGTEAEWLESLVGPEGDQGEPGVNAEGAYVLETVSLVVENPTNTTHVLPNVPRPNSLKLYLNGLLERKASYNLVGNTVDFQALELDLGDEITFDYMYGV